MTEFEEFDMSEDEFDTAAAKGEPVMINAPIGWRCQHMSLTSVPLAVGVDTAWCGCKMRPVWPTRNGWLR